MITMDAIAYWLPLVGFVGMFVFYLMAVRERQIADDLLSKGEEMRDTIDASIAILVQRNRDFAEAIELMHYGARDEALELLRQWGEVVELGPPA